MTDEKEWSKISLIGIDLDDATFIGDSISDIQAALAAGVRPLLVLTGLGAEDLREHCHEVHGASILYRILDKPLTYIAKRIQGIGSYH